MAEDDYLPYLRHTPSRGRPISPAMQGPDGNGLDRCHAPPARRAGSVSADVSPRVLTVARTTHCRSANERVRTARTRATRTRFVQHCSHPRFALQRARRSSRAGVGPIPVKTPACPGRCGSLRGFPMNGDSAPRRRWWRTRTRSGDTTPFLAHAEPSPARCGSSSAAAPPAAWPPGPPLASAQEPGT
jgi:hypothetical protein